MKIAHGRGLTPFLGLNLEKTIRQNLSKIAYLLKEEGIDIVAMQEVDEKSDWNKYLNLMEFIKEDVVFPYGYLGVNSRPNLWGGLVYGNAILSKYPIQSKAFNRATLGENDFCI